MESGITELTATQLQIFAEGKTHLNTLLCVQPNTGTTLGLTILLLEIIDPNDKQIKAMLVCSTKEGAKKSFKAAMHLTNSMQIRCGLATFDDPVSSVAQCESQLIIGTPAALAKNIGSQQKFRMIAFDDANKSMSYQNTLLDYDSKYICTTPFSSKSLISLCRNKLKMIVVHLEDCKLLSSNLCHMEINCNTQWEKFEFIVEICRSTCAKQIMIFALVCLPK